MGVASQQVRGRLGNKPRSVMVVQKKGILFLFVPCFFFFVCFSAFWGFFLGGGGL